jgi:hypothetical protein
MGITDVINADTSVEGATSHASCFGPNTLASDLSGAETSVVFNSLWDTVSAFFLLGLVKQKYHYPLMGKTPSFRLFMASSGRRFLQR